jgi:hypothetical protein
MCLLHRNFLDKATTDYASNPLASPFGASVIASYHSAWTSISLFTWFFERHPHPISRFWNLSTSLLTAANTLATLVIRCPSLPFSEEAIAQIDHAQNVLRTVNATFQLEDVEVSLLECRIIFINRVYITAYYDILARRVPRRVPSLSLRWSVCRGPDITFAHERKDALCLSRATEHPV